MLSKGFRLYALTGYQDSRVFSFSSHSQGPHNLQVFLLLGLHAHPSPSTHTLQPFPDIWVWCLEEEFNTQTKAAVPENSQMNICWTFPCVSPINTSIQEESPRWERRYMQLMLQEIKFIPAKKLFKNSRALCNCYPHPHLHTSVKVFEHLHCLTHKLWPHTLGPLQFGIPRHCLGFCESCLLPFDSSFFLFVLCLLISLGPCIQVR